MYCSYNWISEAMMTTTERPLHSDCGHWQPPQTCCLHRSQNHQKRKPSEQGPQRNHHAQAVDGSDSTANQAERARQLLAEREAHPDRSQHHGELQHHGHAHGEAGHVKTDLRSLTLGSAAGRDMENLASTSRLLATESVKKFCIRLFC